ncbi:lytic transglycosylase domain-containing protein [Ralstonia insidiosa]|jgi:soluble lytic murein transglycosylase-like protein|uniref:lytic transglycosylase domain-containing protein n=1 Tax=Ralstonia TaxID=48736 RepID=UPI0006649D6E|nr:lytic transglycosylase domain-containing protein [Ralstonia insidiosa]KMW48967.1 lytic transglycosylase [Ralstonia sp. MD27]MBX3772224.1 lytic transglycosylase domain-containing protein [Ralstonia pickettii]NOZ17483.1 lytic transglycosylase domain-containing protein [Betaproteobacteria bacterium]MBA9856164.1 lytic transglycosylase domain-containing protein [Ralstonia insidiosa]MBA9870482.1 lytic transglycosylase domain-containing protein [Ralstonia insidiosa]
MKLFEPLFRHLAFALTALALLANQPARADVYGYIDENGLAHFASERVDDRYVLFMKGAAVAGKGGKADKADERADTAIALPATELPDADAYLNASKRDALDNAGMRQRLVRAVLQHPNVPTVEPLIRQAASKHGIDPALVKAVIAAESGFNPQAVSPKGAIGLMQVIPDTGARYGVTGDARRTAAQKLADPKINITTGVRYLSDLLRMFSGNLELVLAAYNAGEGAVQKHGNDIPPYAETQNYVKTVMQFYRYYNPMAEMNGAGGFMTVSANGAMVTRKPGRTGRSARIEVVLDPATGVVTNAQQH